MQMSEFEAYKMMVNDYEKSNTSSSDSSSSRSSPSELDCPHDNYIYEKGNNICTDCGLQISKIVSHNKEWRFYGDSDNRRSSDPVRVIGRKDPETNIFKDVENLGFSDKIVQAANLIYKQVTDNKIFRNNSRKAIIFASIFHAYKLDNNPQSHEKLIQILTLSKKTALKGLKYISLNAPRSSIIRTTYITPENLINEIMCKFDANPVHIEEVNCIYRMIKNKSSKINRSRPMSISSSVIYYWIQTTHKKITLKEFTSKINLSELTITKLTKEIRRIIEK